MGSLNLPAAGPVYVDAQVLIYTVEPHIQYAPLLAPLWQALATRTAEVVSSELSLMETLVGPLQIGDPVLRNDYETFFRITGIRLEPITTSVLRRAADVRATTRLRTPDAIHAATALHLNCPLLLTNDKSFRRLTGLTVQLLDDLLTP